MKTTAFVVLSAVLAGAGAGFGVGERLKRQVAEAAMREAEMRFACVAVDGIPAAECMRIFGK